MTDEELIARMRSQVGDDVQHIYDHEVLFRIAADRIEALVNENAALRAERGHWMTEARRTLRDGQDALDRAEAAEARVAALEAAIDSQDANEAGLWRFWSHKASELATKNAQLMQAGAKAEAQIAALTARAEKLRGALQEIAELNSPEKAWEAIQAKQISRAALTTEADNG